MNESPAEDQVPFRWRAFGALAGELALRAAARRARPEEDRPLPIAWAAE